MDYENIFHTFCELLLKKLLEKKKKEKVTWKYTPAKEKKNEFWKKEDMGSTSSSNSIEQWKETNFCKV